MKVRYNKALPIAGIGIHPSMRWGPQLWFRDYRVASLIADPDWQSYSLEQYAGKDYYQGKHSTQALLRDTRFQEMLSQYFRDCQVMTHKPVIVPDELTHSGVRFMSDTSTLGVAVRFENKVTFRRMFEGEPVNLPPYRISTWSELAKMSASELFAGRQSIVVQDATSSGGRGTFIVRNMTAIRESLSLMEAQGKMDNEVVISDYIGDAAERSIQGVVTRYGVFIGPVQRQLVAHLQLTDTTTLGAGLFCGVEIRKKDQRGVVFENMTRQARSIGQKLQEAGYRGIFGVDFLATGEEVYTLEVNARITGATPLLTIQYSTKRGHIPFLLLHILEMAGAEYSIEDPRHINDYDDCSLIIPHLLTRYPMEVRKNLRMGLYDFNLHFSQPGFQFDDGRPKNEQIVIQDYTSGRGLVHPGKKLATVFLGQAATTDDGRLDGRVSGLLDRMMKHWAGQDGKEIIDIV